MEALKHPNQAARLERLRSYDILDTPRDSDFDDIALLASQICGTAISVVNLIDADRQWFKAEVGLGVRETPLETSICSHVILEEEFVEIPDTLEDPRMANNPLCTGDPGLRFYAGALLKSDDGLPLGTLCVLDYAPRILTPHQRDALRVLSRQVMAQMDMRRALNANKLLRQEIDHRVKNSLQSLSSLVGIQERRAAGNEARKALQTVHSRIEAVSRLHSQLYRTDDHLRINLKTYLEEMRQNMTAMAPHGVHLVMNAASCAVPTGQAVAVGTLVNEFVANSYKHAFPDGMGGTITIRIGHGQEPGTLRVSCSDTGVGLPAEADPARGGLGTLIAQVIGAELNSELEVSSSSAGLTVELEFVIEAPTGARA
ncbi:sensor histidine kinase [Roseovarius sp. D0-M9]|uniref:sensor histidine kinase n=1 Tax=Roseovarius sp. D0-M9 TaxID=3127117 RepID=UPI0030102E75